jgi:hypothetical protein
MLRFARAMAALIPLLGARIALADDDGTKAPEAKPPQIHLVVDGEPGVLMERRQNVAEGWNLTFPPAYQHIESWEVACVAPCSTVVDAGSLYRINGSGVATSYAFTLPQGRDIVHMHFVARTELLHAAGVALTLIGGIVTLLGIAGVVSSPIVSDAAAAADLRVGGWVSAGIGAAIMGAGIATWITTHSYATTDDCQTLGSVRSMLVF